MSTKTGPTSQWPSLGRALKELRERKGLTLGDVAERIPTLYGNERSIRHLEAGERRPARDRLMKLLVNGLEVLDTQKINQILIEAEYDSLSMKEESDINEKAPYKPHAVPPPESLPIPQLVRWAPVDGGQAGIFINSVDGQFISWVELKQEILVRLLPKVKQIPPGCSVITKNYEGHRDFVVRIIDPTAKEIGAIWFGPDPYKKWAYDGLVRVGWLRRPGAPKTVPPPERVIWLVAQRCSDGSYLTLQADETEERPRPLP